MPLIIKSFPAFHVYIYVYMYTCMQEKRAMIPIHFLIQIGRLGSIPESLKKFIADETVFCGDGNESKS